MKDEIAHHTRMGHRKNIIQSLQNASHLSHICLSSKISSDLRRAKKDVETQNFIINSVRCLGSSKKFSALNLLDDLCYQLCEMHKLPMSPVTISESMVRLISRSNASMELFPILKSLIESSNLLLMKINNDEGILPPVEVDLFVSSGQLHATVSNMTQFGFVSNWIVFLLILLFLVMLIFSFTYWHLLKCVTNLKHQLQRGELGKKGNVSSSGHLIMNSKNTPPKPWIIIDIFIEERINFSSGDIIRFAKVKTLL